MEVRSSSEVNYFDNLPALVWKQLLAYLSSDEVVVLSSVCKEFEQKVKLCVKHFEFIRSGHRYFNEKWLLNHALSDACTSLNLNHCYWLEPNYLLQILNKAPHLQHLHVMECGVHEQCIQAICDQQLHSLSITFCSLWNHFLKHNPRVAHGNFKCFHTLRSLQLFYIDTVMDEEENLVPSMIFTTSALTLKCKQLESLKIVEAPSIGRSLGLETLHSQFTFETSPLPNLRRLVIEGQDCSCMVDMVNFLKAILKNKSIPLEHVNFGYFTGIILKKVLNTSVPAEIQCDPKIFMSDSTLFLSDNNSDFGFWLDLPGFESLFGRSSYEKIILENVGLKKFEEFVEKIIVNSSQTLKEFHITTLPCFQFLVPKFLEAVSRIPLNCVHITVFDLSVRFYDGNDIVQNNQNEAVMDALTNLTNLTKLILNPQMLHWKKHTSSISLWKVTRACNKLTEIRIVDISRGQFDYDSSPTVHQDSLYSAFDHCKSLTVLHLVHFDIYAEEEKFDLSRITKSCILLQQLNIFNVAADFNGTALEQSLIYPTNLKALCIHMYPKKIELTETFIDNLCKLKDLEKLYLRDISISPNLCQHLADSILKLVKIKVSVFDAEKKWTFLNSKEFSLQDPKLFKTLAAEIGGSTLRNRGLSTLFFHLLADIFPYLSSFPF